MNNPAVQNHKHNYSLQTIAVNAYGNNKVKYAEGDKLQTNFCKSKNSKTEYTDHPDVVNNK